MRNHGIEMGAIYCKHCMTLIDTQPTKKVTNYYSECKEEACVVSRSGGGLVSSGHMQASGNGAGGYTQTGGSQA
ncbi:GapA-binding peptide SR1P [Paenibacillus sp. Leaf72]|uniref:GapA-binding peptide SR1P n=1 Tax=Paenibacillus sp. Leaf72 TaxID=1736234 RepID=UPI000B0D9132|nr:GapA-binding peptide SR1P [Paenibacillus sp. Leaf72]